MTRRAGLLLLLALPGLFLYLWPALSAPVVLWSDSEIDLKWAREGVGRWTPTTREEARRDVHPFKPGYILYLRLASRAIPKVGEARSAVIVQSVLLWVSIAATSFALVRRRGVAAGIALYVALILFLPLRNSTSAVMSESISAALLLPLIAFPAISPPRTIKGVGALALGLAILVAIRPNVGAIGFLVVAVLFLVHREFRHGAVFLALFSALALVGWLAQRPVGAWRSAVADILVFGSAEYYWRPEIGEWPETGEKDFFHDPRTRRALENWRHTIARGGPDLRRDLVWRALHGLLGTEHYDARWSSTYERLSTASRITAPFLVLAAAALLLAARLSGPERENKWAGALLLPLLVAQNLAIGSHPRFVLPFLPVLILLGVLAFRAVATTNAPRRRILVTAVFLFLLAATAANAHVLDWQWGRVESAGVRIRQRIPKGSLPREAPATLHVRIASPVVPSSAHFMVLAPDQTILYRSDDAADRREPAITAPLPQQLLDANRAGAVEIEVVTFGSYGEFDYLLFPVIPPPWRTRAVREGSDALSPTTGIRSGALDWWAHSGMH